MISAGIGLVRCESYMSANKARGTEPSVQSLLFLDFRLQSMRQALASALNLATLKKAPGNWAKSEKLFGSVCVSAPCSEPNFPSSMLPVAKFRHCLAS